MWRYNTDDFDPPAPVVAAELTFGNTRPPGASINRRRPSLPLVWTLGEGPPVIAVGVAMLWLLRSVPRGDESRAR